MPTTSQKVAIVVGAAVLGCFCGWLGAKTKDKISKMNRDKDAIAKAKHAAGL